MGANVDEMYDGEQRRDWNDEERRGDVSVYVLCQDMLRKIVKRKKKVNHPHTFEPFPVRQSLASPTTTRNANRLPTLLLPLQKVALMR